jgi:hypothetical protein
MKTKSLAIPLVLLFGFIALLPQGQAVVPAPDGGYPGGNTAEGQTALLSLTSGGYNTAVGFLSLRSNTTGSFNTAVGAGTLLANTGDQNTATGIGALLSNTGGTENTAYGAFALSHNTTGAGNTAIGFQAGINQATGSNNIYIGDVGSAFDTNLIAIGNLSAGGVAYEKFYVGAVYGVTTALGATLPVIVSSEGQLGTTASAARFKKEIRPMDKISESVLALKPVTFHYKSDKTNTPQFGLVAEDVAEVNPDLVVRDKNGEIYTVRYDAVNAMLLNEFLKEHKAFLEEQRKVEEQEATIIRLQKGIETVIARLEEQESKIQKVSAQLEVSKAAPQTVLNSR